jgi:hypothetical protein
MKRNSATANVHFATGGFLVVALLVSNPKLQSQSQPEPGRGAVTRTRLLPLALSWTCIASVPQRRRPSVGSSDWRSARSDLNLSRGQRARARARARASEPARGPERASSAPGIFGSFRKSDGPFACACALPLLVRRSPLRSPPEYRVLGSASRPKRLAVPSSGRQMSSKPRPLGGGCSEQRFPLLRGRRVSRGNCRHDKQR